MSQYKLNGPSILCIEKDMIKNIDVDTIISDFASRKSSGNCFV